MEFSMHQQPPFPWHYLLSYPCPFYFLNPQTYVHWVQTPESHIYSADLPGVRKEEIKVEVEVEVEVEDSVYLIIRTEGIDESTRPAMSFKRKFRLPVSVDIDGISAGYQGGILTVTVPRSCRRGLVIDPLSMRENLAVAAMAA